MVFGESLISVPPTQRVNDKKYIDGFNIQTHLHSTLELRRITSQEPAIGYCVLLNGRAGLTQTNAVSGSTAYRVLARRF